MGITVTNSQKIAPYPSETDNTYIHFSIHIHSKKLRNIKYVQHADFYRNKNNIQILYEYASPC